MREKEMDNTFITDDGQIIFCNAWELDEYDLDHISQCETVVKRVEERYKTKDISTMMLEGIGRNALRSYIDAKRDLLVLYGIE